MFRFVVAIMFALGSPLAPADTVVPLAIGGTQVYASPTDTGSMTPPTDTPTDALIAMRIARAASAALVA